MLGKLIKYDFLALSKILLPTQLAVLLASVIGAISLTFILRSDTTGAIHNVIAGFMVWVSGIITAIMILAIIASALLVWFIIFQRFYKSFMKDEAYLTFTLPVGVASLLGSKLITALLWSAINALVITLGAFIIMMFGTASRGIINTDMLYLLSNLADGIFEVISGNVMLFAIEIALVSAVSVISHVLIVFLAIIIGGIVARKHKILAGIGFYFALNIVISMIVRLANALIGVFVPSPAWSINIYNMVDELVRWARPYLIFNIGMYAAISTGLFLTCHFFLKNKLNLE